MKRLGAVGIAVAVTSFLVPSVAEGQEPSTHDNPDHWCPAGASVDFLEPEDTWPFTDCMDEEKPPKEEPPKEEPPKEEPPKEEPPPPPRVKPAPPVPGKPAFTG